MVRRARYHLMKSFPEHQLISDAEIRACTGRPHLAHLLWGMAHETALAILSCMLFALDYPGGRDRYHQSQQRPEKPALAAYCVWRTNTRWLDVMEMK